MANRKISEDLMGLSEAILRFVETEVRVIGVMLEKPTLGYMIREIDKITDNMEEKYKLRSNLKRLEKQGYVNWKHENNETVLILEEKGKKRLQQYDLHKIKLKKPKSWDRLYRVIIFDIPEKKKNARENLRKKLRELEFYKLQKSVFVSPYECKAEVDFLASAYGIEKYVQYLLVKDIPNINPKLWFV